MDTHRRKNKPKALNTALPACRGDVVGVFDAEDEVHPLLLRHVDARFTDTGAEVVQGGDAVPAGVHRALVVLVVEVVGLGEFCRNYGFRPRLRDYLRLVLATPLYHLLLTTAAVRAVARELRGNQVWEKTAHVGAHRAATVPLADAPSWQATDRTA